jgi:large-conductance mechanosensitive channel
LSTLATFVPSLTPPLLVLVALHSLTFLVIAFALTFLLIRATNAALRATDDAQAKRAQTIATLLLSALAKMLGRPNGGQR